MDDKMPIKYVLIGDAASVKIITEFSAGNIDSKKKKEINRIFNKLAKLPNKKYDERNKIIRQKKKKKNIQQYIQVKMRNLQR